MNLIFRQPTANELLLILNSWIRSYAESPHNQIRLEEKDLQTNKYTPKQDYFGYQHLLIRSILSRETTQLMVVAEANLPTELLGYLVYEVRGPVLVVHWMYTKHTFRRLGISKAMLAQAQIGTDELVFTHLGTKYHKLQHHYQAHTYIRQWAFRQPNHKDQ